MIKNIRSSWTNEGNETSNKKLH